MILLVGLVRDSLLNISSLCGYLLGVFLALAS